MPHLQKLGKNHKKYIFLIKTCYCVIIEYIDIYYTYTQAFILSLFWVDVWVIPIQLTAVKRNTKHEIINVKLLIKHANNC